MDESGQTTLPAEHQARLISGPVWRTLVVLAGPMLVGHLSEATFNLADTYFVAQLGTDALAAMGFIFPVVMFVGSLAVGLGIGTSSAISRAIGRGDRHRVRRLTTYALMLGLLLVAVLLGAGLATIHPLFGAMGARGHVLELIEQYMTVWYVGMAFVVVPMVGNFAIRATGDTVSPSAIMLVANGLNLVLDPLLIFGLWGLPRLGIVGAAVATVIGRATALIGALAILHFRKRMLTFSRPRAGELWRAWRQVLYVGIPAAATILLGPVSLGVVTWMVSSFGRPAVGALGAGVRVEMFAMMVVIALASVMTPFAGQNWGARLFGRVRRAHRSAELFGIAWGVLCLGAFFAASRPIARLFSAEPLVIDSISLFLRIVPLGYAGGAVAIVTGSGMNGINRPLHAAALGATRVMGLQIPLAALGGWGFGFAGILAGLALANLLAGGLALLWIRRLHAAAMPSPAT